MKNTVSDNSDNIPLDEMMRNLKKSSAKKSSTRVEGGERVLRADGSEAIKVKSKKRRRSVQDKKKKSNKYKVVLIAVAIGLLLLSVIAFSILLGYFNGNKFKSKVTYTVVNVSGAEVELGRLDVSPASAKLSNVDLKWVGEDTLVKSLKLNDIKANYGMLAFIGEGWSESSLGIEKADLVVEMAQKNPRFNVSDDRPFDFKFGSYSCSELNVDFGEGSLLAFSKGSVTYRASGDQFTVDRGDLRIPLFGDFKVNTGIVSLNADSAQVYFGLMAEGKSGSINFDGSIGYSEGSAVDFKIELEDYILKEWVDPRARRFISGKIESGKGTFKMKLGDVDSFEISTQITSRLIRLDDFEFVKSLSDYLQEEYYIKPKFQDESKFNMKRTRHRTEFTDIDLLQDTQLRIKGNFAIDENDKLSGTLKVGLPVTVISTKKGELLKEVFIEDDGEYIWADAIISGKSSTPTDSLARRLVEASDKKTGVKRDEGVELLELKFKELTK